MLFHYIREGQPGSELFTFVVKAADLLKFAKVDRFNEVEEGVERQLNYNQVLKLVEFMRQPNACLPEPILGDLRGSWVFDNLNQTVGFENGAYLCVDDGQHRIAGVLLLKPEEREKWEFKITASRDTPYQNRLSRFLQQLKRLRLDTNLVLQIQDRADLFPDPVSRVTYQIAKRLAADPASPLCGLIRLRENVPLKLPQGTDGELLSSLIGDIGKLKALKESIVGMVSVSAIMRDLRLVTASVNSLIHALGADMQFRLLVCLLEMAKEIWPKEWLDSDNYFLRRSSGLGGIIQLLAVGKDFRELTRKPIKTCALEITPEAKDAIRQALQYASGYNWSLAQFRNKPGIKFPSAREITRGLDSLIYQNRPRSGSTRRMAGTQR